MNEPKRVEEWAGKSSGYKEKPSGNSNIAEAGGECLKSGN